MTTRSTQRCVVVPDDEFKKLKSKMDQLKALNRDNQLLLSKMKECKCDMTNKDEIIDIEEKYETPMHPVLNASISPTEVEFDAPKPQSLADEIDYDLVFSKNQKNNARMIANAAEQVFSWNKRGELIEDGKVLDKTNILHIIGFLLNPLNTWKVEDIPEKLEYFLSRLRTTNLPVNKIKNQNAKQIFIKGKGLLRPRNKGAGKFIRQLKTGPKQAIFDPLHINDKAVIFGWRIRK